MYQFIKLWLELKTDRRAVTALEYGLIAALVAVAAIGGLQALGTNLGKNFTTLSTDI